LALQHGCDGFEFDVRYTKDARCVICHDALHNRRRIDRRIFAELNLPEADTVVRSYAGRAYLDIELKVAGQANSLLSALRGISRERFAISSFLPQVIEAVADTSPQVPLGLICENLRQFHRWEKMPVSSLMIHRRLASRDVIDELHAAGKNVFVWTVNREREMRELAEREVDGLISDDTRLLAKTFASSRSARSRIAID
jgi:glycerophosphoryl diester phosphodiesterase